MREPALWLSGAVLGCRTGRYKVPEAGSSMFKEGVGGGEGREIRREDCKEDFIK